MFGFGKGGIRSFLAELISGVGGKPESGRALWVGGSAVYIAVTPAFQLFDMAAHNAHFDPLSFSTGYAGGLSAILGIGGLGIATKDKGVAKAAATTADAANPKQVEVINTPDNPVPTEDQK